MELSRSSKFADGKAAHEWATGRVECRELLNDLGWQLYVWARSSVAGREPASAMSRFAGMRRGHEVSILMTLVGAVGRCRGVAPRAKTSMMIMRPPQHGQVGWL